MSIQFVLDTKEFDRYMKKIDADMRVKVAKEAMVAGGEVAVAQAKINVNNWGLWKMGKLANSIDVRNPTPTSIEFGSTGVIYAAIHEFGGVILPKRAKALHWVDDDGNDVFALRVVMPARPYIRPVLQEHRQDILDAIAAKVKSYLEASK